MNYFVRQHVDTQNINGICNILTYTDILPTPPVKTPFLSRQKWKFDGSNDIIFQLTTVCAHPLCIFAMYAFAVIALGHILVPLLQQIISISYALHLHAPKEENNFKKNIDINGEMDHRNKMEIYIVSAAIPLQLALIIMTNRRNNTYASKLFRRSAYLLVIATTLYCANKYIDISLLVTNPAEYFKQLKSLLLQSKDLMPNHISELRYANIFVDVLVIIAAIYIIWALQRLANLAIHSDMVHVNNPLHTKHQTDSMSKMRIHQDVFKTLRTGYIHGNAAALVVLIVALAGIITYTDGLKVDMQKNATMHTIISNVMDIVHWLIPAIPNSENTNTNIEILIKSIKIGLVVLHAVITVNLICAAVGTYKADKPQLNRAEAVEQGMRDIEQKGGVASVAQIVQRSVAIAQPDHIVNDFMFYNFTDIVAPTNIVAIDKQLNDLAIVPRYLVVDGKANHFIIPHEHKHTVPVMLYGTLDEQLQKLMKSAPLVFAFISISKKPTLVFQIQHTESEMMYYVTVDLEKQQITKSDCEVITVPAGELTSIAATQLIAKLGTPVFQYGNEKHGLIIHSFISTSAKKNILAENQPDNKHTKHYLMTDKYTSYFAISCEQNGHIYNSLIFGKPKNSMI
jgi:hypothetical protein